MPNHHSLFVCVGGYNKFPIFQHRCRLPAGGGPVVIRNESAAEAGGTVGLIRVVQPWVHIKSD